MQRIAGLKRQLAGSAQHIYSSSNRINVHQTDGAGRGLNFFDQSFVGSDNNDRGMICSAMNSCRNSQGGAIDTRMKAR